jgi:predicted NodU family carbamoyl transferase
MPRVHERIRRAPGGRSIVADRRNPEMNAEANNVVNFRERWRRFALLP